ncbi:hypothetical protein [Sulfuricurvum sp.]|uniref:hypothetical protein n=1 Tax=Sulfuricurvum sp. TaxID=2025608 RepID=UPI00261AA341|nr:hypothetical protein [Sulfuricurvum sp.]MDD4949641.1 hypothetical protein [Sulfuricurvum sp.]
MTQGVGFNTVQNMAEDVTMMVGYSLFNEFIHDKLSKYLPAEYDANGKEKMNIPLEVLSGGGSYLFTSATMKLIQKEEKFLEYLFAAGEAVIIVLYARNKNWIESAKAKIGALRGYKAVTKKQSHDSQTDVTNSFVGQVYQAMQTIIHGRDSSSVTDTIQAGTAEQEHALNRENTNLNFAKANNDAFSKSLLLKIATGGFTQTDEAILKKVIGRSDFATTPIDHNELNKIKEFMIITDSNGKFVGLTKVFTELLNGLAFINK